jgi:hypothetical protein
MLKITSCGLPLYTVSTYSFSEEGKHLGLILLVRREMVVGPILLYL